MFVT
jgi:hypothetical protein